MMKKIITQIPLFSFPAKGIAVLSALLFLFASCDKDDMPGGETDTGDPEKIRFEMVHATATATPSGTPQTRVSTSTDGNYTNTWTDGDKVGLYIVKGSADLQSFGNWVDNMEMTYNNGSWTYTLPAGKEYYPKDGDALSFYAYYPYMERVAIISSIHFIVQADQSIAGNSSKSYFLMAEQTSVDRSHNPVQLSFAHGMTMMELTVTSGGEEAQLSDLVSVTMEGRYNSVVADLSKGTVSTHSHQMESIKMSRMEQPGDANYSTTYTYRAVVPAQNITAGTELFRFTFNSNALNGKLSHRPSAEVTLSTGSVTTYSVTLSPSHKYAVGDVYPHSGPAQGVVFWLDTSDVGYDNITDPQKPVGKKGKIVSSTQGNAAWSTEMITVGTSETDGEANTEAVKKLADWGNKYPAFKWCADQGEGWYLPAFYELLALFTVWNGSDDAEQVNESARQAFNNSLVQAGGVSITIDYYFSSSERPANSLNQALGKGFGNTTFFSSNITKNLPFPVRAIRRF